MSCKFPIVIFSAPPRAGKDTLALALHEALDIDSEIREFKSPMFAIAAQTMGIPFTKFINLYQTNLNDWKDTPRPDLGNKSVRQLLIQISEVYIKPFFGDNYFGRMAAEKVERSETIIHPNGKVSRNEHVHIFADGGFPVELMELVGRYPERVRIIRVHRDGTSFAGDSRNWLDMEGVPSLDLDNNRTIEEALDDVRSWLEL